VEEAAFLTRVNYAFATIQYAPSLDVWYLAPTDPYADMDKCFDGACSGNQPDIDAKCIKLSNDDFAFFGTANNPTVNLAPFIGSGDAGRTLNQPGDCFFAGGVPLPNVVKRRRCQMGRVQCRMWRALQATAFTYF